MPLLSRIALPSAPPPLLASSPVPSSSSSLPRAATISTAQAVHDNEILAIRGVRLLTSTGVESRELTEFLDSMAVCEHCALFFTPGALERHKPLCPCRDDELELQWVNGTSSKGKGRAI